VANGDLELSPLRPAEFCALERHLVAAMAMRKKRNVKMEAAQELKLRLLEYVEQADPEPRLFTAVLGEAIVSISGGVSTGPAQAVASDLQMDWDMACTSPGFVSWLRESALRAKDRTPPPPSFSEGGRGRGEVGVDFPREPSPNG
jgi:hypothetical protein